MTIPFIGNLSRAQQLTAGDYLFDNKVLYFIGFTNGFTLTTLSGENLTVTLEGKDLYFNNARLTNPDYLISSGVMHVLDRYFINLFTPLFFHDQRANSYRRRWLQINRPDLRPA